MKKMMCGVAALALAVVWGKDLVWNGGNGGVWSDSNTVWLDGETPCAWEDGATAVFGSSGFVVVEGTVKAGGISFTSTGTSLVGAGLIELNGAIAAAADTQNAIAARLYASPAMSKTGTGTVALAYARGSFAIEEGTVLAGGYNMRDVTVTVSEGASLKSVSGGDKAETLLTNGSFETPYFAGYRYINSSTTPTGWLPKTSNCVVHMNDNASHGTWGNALSTVPDGKMILAIQMNGAIQQTVTVAEDGYYDLSFVMFKRGSLIQYGTHQLYIYLDDHFWQPFYDDIYSGYPKTVDTGAVYLTAGTHTVKLTGEGFWGDTTTFVDDCVLATPILADATSIPSSSGVMVDVASGEETLDTTYTLTTDSNGYQHFTKTGAGKAIFTQNLAITGRTIYDVEGEVEYTGTITGSYEFHKRGAGSLTLATPSSSYFKIENGDVRVRSFTSAMSVAYRVEQGGTAGFYPGLAAGDASLSSLVFQGNGTCTIGTLGDGRTLTISGGATLNVPTAVFDVGAGDTIKLGDLRAELVGNDRTYVDTDVIKSGAGTLELTASPSCLAPTTLTVREGTLQTDIADAAIPLTIITASQVTNHVVTYGLMRGGTAPLVLGDRNTPASGAVALAINKSGFTTERPLTLNAQPASATVRVTAGTASWLGPITANRASTILTGTAGTALTLGNLVRGDTSAAAFTLDAAMALYLEGTVSDGISLTAAQATDFNLAQHAVATRTFDSFALGGACTVDFDANGQCDTVTATTLTLGTTAFTLNDLFRAGGYAIPGRYVIAHYGTFAGDVAELSVANPISGNTYAFTAADGELALTIAPTADSDVFTWTGSEGEWSTGANWLPASVPNGTGVEVVFPRTATTATTATLAGGITAGTLTFENVNGVTLTGGTVTFASEATPTIRVYQGAVTIASALQGAVAVRVETYGTGSVTFTGSAACDLILAAGANVSFGSAFTTTGNVRVEEVTALGLPNGGTITDAGLKGLKGTFWQPTAWPSDDYPPVITN